METIVLWPEQRQDENDFLPFERKYIEARKTRTETKENKVKQFIRAQTIQLLPSASGKWITYVWCD